MKKFTFQFVLANGGREWRTFVAHCYTVAAAAAATYADLLFADGEVLDFFLEVEA